MEMVLEKEVNWWMDYLEFAVKVYGFSVFSETANSEHSRTTS